MFFYVSGSAYALTIPVLYYLVLSIFCIVFFSSLTQGKRFSTFEETMCFLMFHG